MIMLILIEKICTFKLLSTIIIFIRLDAHIIFY